MEAITCARVPDFDGAVTATGEDPAAVLRKADAIDKGRMASKFLSEKEGKK